MDTTSYRATFFDIAGTLATVRVAPGGDHIRRVTVYPGVIAVLEALAAEGVRLGIIADPGTIPAAEIHAALEHGGIRSFFDEHLILLGSKRSPRLFRKAAALVGCGCKDAALVYVGGHEGERAQAGAAGFRAAPHPVLARPLVQRPSPLRYLRIRLPAEPGDLLHELSQHALVPFHLTALRDAEGSGVLYAIASEETAAVLEGRGLPVDYLGAVDAPQGGAAYLLHPRPGDAAPGTTQTSPVLPVSESVTPFLLDATDDELIIALPADRPLSSIGLQNPRYWHAAKLVPSVTLLRPVLPPAELFGRAGGAFPPRLLSDDEVEVFARHVTPCLVARDVARYAGDPIEARVVSRHIHHPGNARAVAALLDDLEQAGSGLLRVASISFRHDERDLENVEAILQRPATVTSREIVVVGAHLDSTANDQPCYRPSIDPAPGADDDASGIAGVLAAARACVELASRGIAHREIRFVLFNAEEEGITGSGEYAAECREHREEIVAMFHMDMIGHDLTPPRHFELHAGLVPLWPSDGVALQAASARLVELIERLWPEVSKNLPAPQVSADSSDRAVGHSDHTRFHGNGYPACLASEDFFPGLGGPGDRNPNYHRPIDTTINGDYAADIARLVAAAAWVAATQNL